MKQNNELSADPDNKEKQIKLNLALENRLKLLEAWISVLSSTKHQNPQIGRFEVKIKSQVKRFTLTRKEPRRFGFLSISRTRSMLVVETEMDIYRERRVRKRGML
ncbi:hypothetical protein V6Z11_D04G030500 [Gossypium hirsutum]